MTKIGIIGASGRMGKEISRLADQERAVEVVFGVDRNQYDCGFPIYSGFTDIKETADVIIDFSLPDLLDSTIEYIKSTQSALVSGVTGLSDDDFARMEKLSKKNPVLFSANMSLGIAVVKKCIENLTPLEGYDFQIEETHHNQKKDKPSGTSVALQNKLNSVIKKTHPEVLSIRGGGVFGIHRVSAFGEEEIVSIEHNALKRSVFARGAIFAAKWVKDQKPGWYSLESALGWQ
jgi:4-hydroxy-tetrahydrodipicolinate reductase